MHCDVISRIFIGLGRSNFKYMIYYSLLKTKVPAEENSLGEQPSHIGGTGDPHELKEIWKGNESGFVRICGTHF